MNLLFKISFALGLIAQSLYDALDWIINILPDGVADGFLMGFDSVFDVFEVQDGDGGIEFIDDDLDL